MDTFMANLSSEVGVFLKEHIAIIMIISLLSTAAYNALETVFITFDIFKDHRALYFWSMQVASWGILVHALPAILCSISQAPTLPILIPFIIGWYAMVTGQAVVLYSRLRIVMFDTSRVRWVLWMIVANVCILHVPMTVLFFLRICGNTRFARSTAIYNRIQLVGFFVQESVIWCIYLYEVVRNLMCIARVRGREGRNVSAHLLSVSGLISVLNILLLLTEYKMHFIQVSFKAVVYSIKLRLEFTLLYHLRSPMHSDPLACSQDQMRHCWSASNMNLLNTNLPRSTVAPDVIGPSGADLAGELTRCHSPSSSTPGYHEILREISHRPGQIRGYKGAE